MGILGRSFAQMITALRDKAELEVTAGDTLHVKSGPFQTHIKGIDAEEFPAIQTATIMVWMTMNFQLPRKPVTRSAMRAPSGASSMSLWLTG